MEKSTSPSVSLPKQEARILKTATLETIIASSESLEKSGDVTISLIEKQPVEHQRKQSIFPEKITSLLKKEETKQSSAMIVEEELFTGDRKRSSTLDQNVSYRKRASSTIVSLFSRKRSSTSNPQSFKETDIPPVPTVTQVLQNTSIFKADSSSGLPQTVTVTTQDKGITEESLIMPSRRKSSNRLAGHIKSFTVSNNNELTLKRDRRRTSAFRGREASVKDQKPLPAVPSPHKRDSSKATFFSPSNATDIKKQTYRIPGLKIDQLRVPRRWLSLRNVLSFFNILILTIAILVISLVSYFAGTATTQSAINATSNVTINDLMFKLDEMITFTEQINVFSQTIFTTPEYSIYQSQKAMRHLYFLQSQHGTANNLYDQIYHVDQFSNFNGVALDRDFNGEVRQNTLIVKYLTRSTNKRRLVFRVDGTCKPGDFSCVNLAFSNSLPPISNTTYNATSRPFFEHATRTNRTGWSSIYQYMNQNTLGITAVRPVYQLNRFWFIACVDISLGQLGDYLKEVSSIMAHRGRIVPFISIVEPSEAGELVATSDHRKAPVITQQGTRVRASDSIASIRFAVSKLLSVSRNNSLSGLVWDENGAPFVFQDSESNGNIMVGRYLRSFGDIDWLVIVYIPNELYSGFLNNAHYIQIPIAAAIVLILSTICSIIVTRWIAKPLKQIAQQMLNVADLNFEQNDEDDNIDKTTEKLPAVRKTEKKGFRFELKEVQYLRSAMNAMKSGLKSFSKYVPLDIVTLLVKMKREAVLGVDELEITVFFSDIVNFTTLAEKIPPKQLVAVMSEYLSEMSNIIIESSGIVDKYIGDAIMAIWNAPIATKDHATIACSVALKCKQRLSELSVEWKQKDLPEIHARIGINTGLALVGNLGSTSRLNYTCLGDTVNLASRLESLNKKYRSEIIISQFTYDQIHRDYFVCRTLDIVTVKGKSRPVRVYELVGFKKLMSSDAIRAYNVYEQAFEMYSIGMIREAAASFELFLALFRDDYVAKCHLKECKKLIAEGCPDDWSCTVQLDEK